MNANFNVVNFFRELKKEQKRNPQNAEKMLQEFNKWKETYGAVSD